MQMKKELSPPVVIGVFAALLVLIGLIAWKTLSGPSSQAPMSADKVREQISKGPMTTPSGDRVDFRRGARSDDGSQRVLPTPRPQ